MQESAFVEDGSFFAYYENSIVLNRNKRYKFYYWEVNGRYRDGKDYPFGNLCGY